MKYQLKENDMEQLQAVADTLDGCMEYDELNDMSEAALKQAGIVVAYGASDDNLEMRGAINDEFGSWDGTKLMHFRGGFVCDDGLKEINQAINDYSTGTDEYEFINHIEAIWCPEDHPDNPAWLIKPNCKHATFKVIAKGEEDQVFCLGAVFYLGDMWSEG